jgi:integrase
MSLWKRGRQYWMDVTVNGQRFREPLGTTDWREARQRERTRIAELGRRPPDPANRGRTFGSLDVKSAVAAYAKERKHQVSARMVAYWTECARPLSAFFGDTPLQRVDANAIAGYQNARIEAGRAPKTVNGEVSVLRQVLRHAKLWYRFQDEYHPLRNTKPPVGQALTDEEQQRLFAKAASRPEWLFAYVAAALAFYCGLRACEIRGLQWKDVDWLNKRIRVRRSKTPAGWRDPSLNEGCLVPLRELWSQAKAVGFAEPDHYVFPWHGRDKKVDPTRSMTSWRSAFRSLRKAARLPTVRFHDGRYTALTRLAEAGQPDWVIQTQLGHVSPAMMKVYSHVRRKALEVAAEVLEPPFPIGQPADEGQVEAANETATSQVTSQSGDERVEECEIPKEIGSSGWTRTSNPPVNSATQVFGLAGLRAGSSDEALLFPGARQRIVQRLFRRQIPRPSHVLDADPVNVRERRC